MGFGVFIHRFDSIYDDSPAERYQFPRQYLGRVESCLHDWIIYYEPRKVAATRGYFAVAKVSEVKPDPQHADMYVALIEPGSYLPFPNPVPFNGPDGVVERGVLRPDGGLTGRAQSAVRPLSPADFHRIVDLGLTEDTASLPRVGPPTRAAPMSLQDEQSPFDDAEHRHRISYLGSRLFRNRIFRSVVLQAYDSCCAVTGLKLINGGGRAEVEAAHIRPVEANGPDSVSNGLALSGTVHWMFDRGLIGISDDLQILISRHVNDAEGVRNMINPTGRIRAPARPADHPHPRFLHWHRDHCFKA